MIGRSFRLVIELWRWFIGVLCRAACLLEPSQGPPELPVTVEPSPVKPRSISQHESPRPCHQVERVVSLPRKQGSERRINLDSPPEKSARLNLHNRQITTPRREQSMYNGIPEAMTIAPSLKKIHPLLESLNAQNGLHDGTYCQRFPRSLDTHWQSATGTRSSVSGSSVASPVSPNCPSGDHTPELSLSPTLSPPSSACPSPDFGAFPRNNEINLEAKRVHGNVDLTNVECDTVIGELGRRRGFKGTPLFTNSTAMRTRFLSLPDLSPSDGQHTPVTIGTPFRMVSDIIRTGTPNSAKFGLKQEASHDNQICYEGSDPFGTISSSFFSTSTSFDKVAENNINNLGAYQRNTHKRTASLTRPTSFEILRDSCKINKRSAMETTLYDTSIFVAPRMRLGKAMANGYSPNIILTPASPMKARIASTFEETSSNCLEGSTSSTSSNHRFSLDDNLNDAHLPSPVFVPTGNLYNFDIYRDAHAKQSSSLRRRTVQPDLQKPTSPGVKKISNMATNVYDRTTYQDASTKPAVNKRFSAPNVMSMQKRTEHVRGLSSHRNSLPAGNSSAHSLRQPLRPLILPQWLARRDSDVSHQTSLTTCNEDDVPPAEHQAWSEDETRVGRSGNGRDRQSKCLDDIIALLDTSGTSEGGNPVKLQSDDCDGGSLLSAYAV